MMVQIIRMFLSKLNVPWNEVETFTEQVKERKMGELFKHFEGWDIQAVRREAREEARKEAREEAVKEIEKAKEEAAREIEKAKEEIEKKKEEIEKKKEEIEEVREKDINKLLKTLKKFHITRDEAITELMREYEFDREHAEKRTALYWQEAEGAALCRQD